MHKIIKLILFLQDKVGRNKNILLMKKVQYYLFNRKLIKNQMLRNLLVTIKIIKYIC